MFDNAQNFYVSTSAAINKISPYLLFASLDDKVT